MNNQAPSVVDPAMLSTSLVARKQIVRSSEDGELSVADFVALPPINTESVDSLAQWSSYAQLGSDVYGDKSVDIRALSGNSASYDKEKAVSFERFLRILQRHKEYYLMLEPVADPDEPESSGIMIPRLFLLLRGNKTQQKMTLLNSIVLVFVMNLRTGKRGESSTTNVNEEDGETDPEKLYQPNTTVKILNHVFAVLRANGVCIGQADLKAGHGSYHAYLKALWNGTAAVRSDYGRLPYRASVLFDDEEAMRTRADPPFRPFEKENYEDLKMMTFYKSCRDSGYRNGEVSCFWLGLIVELYSTRSNMLFFFSFA